MSEPAFLPAKAHQHVFDLQSAKSATRHGRRALESNWKESASLQLQQQKQPKEQQQQQQQQQQQHHHRHHQKRQQQDHCHIALLSPALPLSYTSPSKPRPRPRRQLQLQQVPAQGSQQQTPVDPVDQALKPTPAVVVPTSRTRLPSHGEHAGIPRGSGLSRKRSTSNSSTSTTSVSYLRTAASVVIATAHRTHFRRNNKNNISNNINNNRLSQDGWEADDFNLHGNNSHKVTLRHRPIEQSSSGGDLGTLIGHRSNDPRGHHAQVPSISPPIQLDPEDCIQERGLWEQYRHRASVPLGVEAQSQWQYSVPSMDQGSFSSRGDPQTPLFLTDPFIPLDLATIHPQSSLRSNWSNSTHCGQEQAADGFVPTDKYRRYPLPANSQGDDPVETIENLDDGESFVSELNSNERQVAQRHQDMQMALFSSFNTAGDPIPISCSKRRTEHQRQTHPYPAVLASAETQEDDGDREVLEVYRRRRHPIRLVDPTLPIDDSTPWPTLHQSSSDMEIDMLINDNDSTQQDLSLLNTLAQLEEEVGRLRGVNRGLQSDLDQSRQQNAALEKGHEQRLQTIQKQHEEMVADMKNQLNRQHEQDIQDFQHQESQRVSVLQLTLKTQLTALRNLHRETRDQHRQAEADLTLLLDFLKNTLGPTWIHFCNKSYPPEGRPDPSKDTWSENQFSNNRMMENRDNMLEKSGVLTADMGCKTTIGQACLLILQQLDTRISHINPFVAMTDPMQVDTTQPQSQQREEETGESGVNLLKRRRQQHKRLSDSSSASSGKTIVNPHLTIGTATAAVTPVNQLQPEGKAGQLEQTLATLHGISNADGTLGGGYTQTGTDLQNFIQEKEYLQQCLMNQQADHQLEIENIKQQCIRLYRESLHEVRAELMDKMQHRHHQKRRS